MYRVLAKIFYISIFLAPLAFWFSCYFSGKSDDVCFLITGLSMLYYGLLIVLMLIIVGIGEILERVQDE
jgi:hypothetical protein